MREGKKLNARTSEYCGGEGAREGWGAVIDARRK